MDSIPFRVWLYIIQLNQPSNQIFLKVSLLCSCSSETSNRGVLNSYIWSTFILWRKIMGPLETNRYILTWLCLYPSAEGTGAGKMFAKRIVAAHFFVFTATGLVGSCVFVHQHIKDDLERSLFGILQIAALTYLTYTQLFARFLRPKIISAIHQIRKFHNFRKCSKKVTFFTLINLIPISLEQWHWMV